MHRPGMDLIPPPTDHKHDPLRWPRWLKISVVLTTSLSNFVSNMAGAGPSVAIQDFMQDFSKSQEQVTQLLTVSCSDLHTSPMALRYNLMMLSLVQLPSSWSW